MKLDLTGSSRCKRRERMLRKTEIPSPFPSHPFPSPFLPSRAHTLLSFRLVHTPTALDSQPSSHLGGLRLSLSYSCASALTPSSATLPVVCSLATLFSSQVSPIPLSSACLTLQSISFNINSLASVSSLRACGFCRIPHYPENNCAALVITTCFFLIHTQEVCQPYYLILTKAVLYVALFIKLKKIVFLQ